RVNPWAINYSFKSYLMDGSLRERRGGLSLTSFGRSLSIYAIATDFHGFFILFLNSVYTR
ncbi:MAG: hypothetical protein FWH41_04510, partial [Treponema sp.]|nr:hypothetical protein [Treponema sp.]